ncbi:hypothetical protein ACA910_022338 [Epithemia clementina (nom. ined.)]
MPDRASSSSLDVEEQEDPNESTSHRGLEQTMEELKKENELKLEKLEKENAEQKLKLEKLEKEYAELKLKLEKLAKENAELKTEKELLIKALERVATSWNEDLTNNAYVHADSTTHHGRTESPPTLVGSTTRILDAFEEESEKRATSIQSQSKSLSTTATEDSRSDAVAITAHS